MIVKLPKIGLTMTQGQLVQWYVKSGDFVHVGDNLCEFETDKATSIIESEVDGFVHNIQVEEGASVQVFGALCEINAEMEDSATIVTTYDNEAQIIQQKTPHGDESTLEIKDKIAEPKRVFISPLARKIAKEHNIDMNTIPYSGKRIHKKDVLDYLETNKNQKPISFNTQNNINVSNDTDIEVVKLEGMRAAIATKMSDSKREIPHVYFKVEANATGMLELKKSCTEQKGKKISITAILVKAISSAIKKYPMFHAKYLDGSVYTQKNISVCVAIDVPEGLVTPCIYNSDQIGLSDIASKIEDLAGRAQAGELTVQELTEGAFTLTNLGYKGIDEFQAIINHPQVAILSSGIIKEQVVVENHEMVVRPMINLVLSVDHRVIDGVLAANFLNEIKNNIENPIFMLY